jgi:type I restriction enzyme S subunit
MIVGLKPYPEYKESGVPWLGRIPSHWTVLRIKSVLREVDRRCTNGDGMLLSLTRLKGLVPQTEVSDRMHGAKTLIGYKLYHPGQIVMTRMQAWSGMFGAGDLAGLVSPDYATFRIVGDHDTRFLLHRLKSPDLNWAVWMNGNFCTVLMMIFLPLSMNLRRSPEWVASPRWRSPGRSP